MTKVSTLQELEILPGVMPSTDATPSDIPCWAEGENIRFDPNTGRLRKLAGWQANDFDYDNEIVGTVRTIYSATINQTVYTLLGTESNLYSLIGSELTNITPLDTSSVAAANSLATLYGTLANNPITTVSGSSTVTVADTSASRFRVGDPVTLSGASTTNGIPDTELNAEHIIRSIGANNYTIIVSTSASSSGSGGGASVVRASGLLRLTSALHDLSDGERVKIDNAADTGGILAADINQEFIIRNVATNTFDFMTEGTATSSVTGAGGASTEYYPQIESGAANQGNGQGYGAGRYGVGLYGTALVSPSGETYPRIWFIDRFGDNLVMTPGNNSGCYTWDGDTTVAPTLIPGAPEDVNYLFVSDNILVTFGHDVENKIYASDQGDYTQWTASSTNQVFEDIIEGAGRFISHVAVDGYSLIFTENQVYTFKYIGGTAIWQTLQLDATLGIIAPMARMSVGGYGYWMGQDGWYMFRGGKVEPIPSNFSAESTCIRYVFDNFNYSQRFKFFAGYNENYDELWFFYNSGESNDPDTLVIYNRKIQSWAPQAMSRTAFESPVQSLSNPRLANGDILYTHEAGNNDDSLPMPFSARTKKYLMGKDTAIMSQIVPDSLMSGTVELNVRSYNYPQSATAMNDNFYAVTQTTEKVPAQINGRYMDYTIAGEELDQTYLMGQFMLEPQKSATAP